MKKSKFAKILITALSFCLILGAIIGVSASASAEEGSVTPVIKHANVEYGSRTYLYYAVPVASIPEADKAAENGFWMEVRNTDGSLVFSRVYHNEVKTVSGEECYIFVTRGVPAKELNTEEVVKVVCASGAESEPLTWSVEAYLYNRLFKDGFAKFTEKDGDNYLKRTLYYDLLKYGAVAQELLAPEATDKIGDVSYATAPAAVATLGKLEPGTEIVLKYNESINSGLFVAWAYDQYDRFGELVASGYATDKSSFVVDGFICAEPVYDSGVYTYDPCDTLPSRSHSRSGEWAVGVDPKDASNNTFVSDRSINNANGSAYWFRVASEDRKSDASAVVFQSKIFWENTGNIILEIKLLANMSSSQRVAFVYFNSTNTRFYENGSAGVQVPSGKTVGAWHDVRVEYRVLEANGMKVPECKLFVDGRLVNVSNDLYEKSYYTDGVLDQSKIPAPSSVLDATVLVSSSIKKGNVHFDDVMISHSDAPAAEIVGAKDGLVQMHDSKALYTFGYGSSDAHETTTHDIYTDPVTGNSMLNIVKSNTSSGAGFNFSNPTYKEADANLMVLQFDMYVNTKLGHATTLNFEIRFGVDGQDSSWTYSPFGVSFNSCSIRNAWVTFRIEYRVIETDANGKVSKAEVKVYENGVLKPAYIMTSDNNGDGIRDQASGLIPNGGSKDPAVAKFGKCLVRMNYSSRGFYYFDNASYMLIKE